jgi:hypothetical protein
MTSETRGLDGSNLAEASPLVFTRNFSNLNSSLNVVSISLSLSIMIGGGCGIAISGRLEVEMTPEISGLGGS